MSVAWLGAGWGGGGGRAVSRVPPPAAHASPGPRNALCGRLLSCLPAFARGTNGVLPAAASPSD